MSSTQNSINYTIVTAMIQAAAVTYAKIQNVGAVSLLGNPTGAPAAPSEITLGTNLSFMGSVLNAAATFTPMPTIVVSGTTQSMVVNNTYVSNNAGVVTLTLPATAAVGDEMRVTGLGAGGWSIAQNAGQLIHFGSVASTTGAGGSIASTNQYDTTHIKCVVANTTFNVLSSQGNMTVT